MYVSVAQTAGIQEQSLKSPVEWAQLPQKLTSERWEADLPLWMPLMTNGSVTEPLNSNKM